MDLQKERELFLAHMRSIGSAGFMFELDEDGNFDDMSMAYAWSAWQAAKAQADQKVKLLLCDEHLKKCESPTGIFNSQYPDEEPCLICLAKEAKAQAVPEGFVLVPKEPTPKMIDSTWDYFEDIEGMSHNKRNEFIYKAMIDEAQEPAND